jgi:hypothetical protein
LVIDFYLKSSYSYAKPFSTFPMPSTAREKAVLFLLKAPASRYVRRLKKTLEREPDYLTTHREDVANIIIGFLAGSGLQWHREIFEREWPAILRDAIARLSAKKR